MLMPRHFKSHYLRTIIIGFVFSLVFHSYPLIAQVKKSVVSTDTTKAKKVIEAVPLANIGSVTETTLSKIREIRNTTKSTDSEIKIDSLIFKKLETIKKQKADLDLEEVEKMHLRQTESLKNDITQKRFVLEGWRASFKNKIEEINQKKEVIGELKIQWNKTLNLERDEKLPSQVYERIKTNLTEVNKLAQELTGRNNALLTKQDELTEALIYLEEVLNTITKTEQNYRSNLYTINSPPIWQMFTIEKVSIGSVETDTLTMKHKIDNIIESHNLDFKNFIEIYNKNIYYHISFFAILLVITIYLKIDVSKWSDEKKDEAIKYSLHAISKPFSSSLLVTLLVTRLFYNEIPSDVLNYFHALLVWPILTIVPGLITSIKKKYFYFVGGVFVLSQFSDYFSDIVLFDRLMQLIIDGVTIVLLISLLRVRNKIVEANPNIKWGFAFKIMRFSIFLLSVSVLANSIGNTILSNLLSDGSLVMIYGGIIIYASVLILKGVFALLTQHDVISKLNMIQNYPEEVKGHIFKIINWLAVIYWLYITLSRYSVYEPIYKWTEGMITREWEIGSVSLSIGNVLAFFITLWITLTISKFVRFVLKDEILTHFEMPRGVPGAISMIVRLVLITIGFVLAFGAAKIPFDNIAIIFGAMGVGIGFGLQNIFNHLVSGLILAFERPIQVGDVIQINTLNLMGEVKEIGIRASTVRTFDGAEVIVPNGNLISNEMVNWTLSDSRRRQEILVGVKYGTDTAKVLEVLNEVVPTLDNVLKNPAPFIIFIGFGDSSLDFRVLFWTRFEDGLSTKSAVGIAIDNAFRKNGIEIPFPQRDLHLRSVSDTVDFQHEKKPARSSISKKGNIEALETSKKNEK